MTSQHSTVTATIRNPVYRPGNAPRPHSYIPCSGITHRWRTTHGSRTHPVRDRLARCAALLGEPVDTSFAA